MSTETKGDVSVIEKVNLDKIDKYKVIVHNNDITSYEEVIFIISKVFDKTDEEAYEIAKKVDTEGKGLCGIYDKEVAEAKLVTVQLAKDFLCRDFPQRYTPINALKFTIEAA